MTATATRPESDTVTAEVVSITPALAREWLKQNTRNRPPSASDVATYIRDMNADNWKVTGEAIKFAADGTLVDGQHRLTAIASIKKSVPVLVVRGLAPETQALMDTGRKRSAADQFSLAGKKNATVLQGAARCALKHPVAGFVSVGVTKPTNSEVIGFVDNNPGIHSAAEAAMHYYKQVDIPPSILALTWMRFSAIDPWAAAQFFDAIATMKTEGAGDPRLALARRIATARQNDQRLEPTDYLGLVFRAWNAWRAGREVHRLPMGAGIPSDLI